MIAVMADRTRMIIDTTEEIRIAVRFAATKADKTTSAVVNEILRKALAAELKDARRYVPDRGEKSED
jgi:hypothetical protein